MSSDLYDVEIDRVDGRTAFFWVTTGTAGGMLGHSAGRAFALHVLFDACTASSRAARSESEDGSVAKPPLLDVVDDMDFGDTSYWEEAVPKHIVRTAIVDGKNLLHTREEETAWSERYQAARAELESTHDDWTVIGPLLDARVPRPSRLLRVEVTEARWLEGLAPGVKFGTIASDVDSWDDDPVKPNVPDQLR